MIRQQGFSLLEVLLAISITSVLLLTAGDFVARGINGANQDYHKTVVQSNTKSAVDSIARNIKSAKSVQNHNSQPDANAPGGNQFGWNGVAGSNATLILAVPARSSDGSLLYIDGLHTNIYTNDVIYYLEPATRRLYRRTIASNAAGNVAVTTCPPSIATATCPADSLIIDNVADLTTQYLDRTNSTVSTPAGTEAVRYSVTQTTKLGPRTIKSTYTTITALRNK